MHPAFSLAKRKLDETRREYDLAVRIEAEVSRSLSAQDNDVAKASATALRATGIEGVYTGAEGILKEVLAVADGGVVSVGEAWHSRLLAQAALPATESGRTAIISPEVYDVLDRLRSFRHIERNVYRHSLRDDSVIENFALMVAIFPKFEAELRDFIDNFHVGDVMRPPSLSD